MDNVMSTRAQRTMPPARDDAKIAAILRDAEARAQAEHERLVGSQILYSNIGLKPQTPVGRSQNLKAFPRLSRWKGRFTAA